MLEMAGIDRCSAVAAEPVVMPGRDLNRSIFPVEKPLIAPIALLLALC